MSDPNPTKRPSLTFPLLIAALAGLVVAALVLIPLVRDSQPTSAQEAPTASESETDKALAALIRRDPKDTTAIGDADAPVVMISYSEFQCPFCGKFARDTEPALIKKYVDTGVLRIEWRDFPYLGNESTLAARAGRAAAQQDKFREFHDALFANQQPPNSGKVTPGFLADIAGDVGLDVATFRAALASEEVDALVGKDFEEGQSIGVSGTPTFLINGDPIVGAQPAEVFDQAIRDAADEAK